MAITGHVRTMQGSAGTTSLLSFSYMGVILLLIYKVHNALVLIIYRRLIVDRRCVNEFRILSRNPQKPVG